MTRTKNGFIIFHQEKYLFVGVCGLYLGTKIDISGAAL